MAEGHKQSKNLGATSKF